MVVVEQFTNLHVVDVHGAHSLLVKGVAQDCCTDV